MAMTPIYNPPIGLLTANINKMFVGKMLFLFGKVEENAECFTVELLPSLDENETNVALRITLNYAQKRIHLINCSSGISDNQRNCSQFPLKSGGFFAIQISCSREFFQVGVNDKDNIGTLEHRVPLHTVNFIKVSGEFKMTFMSSAIEYLVSTGYSIPKSKLKVGRLYPVPFYIGMKIHVVAAPNDNGIQFSIVLKNEDDKPCFGYYVNMSLEEVKIVHQASVKKFDDGIFTQAPVSTFPFKTAEVFKTTLTIWEKSVDVDINGEQFTYPNIFKFERLKNLDKFRYLKIDGAVDVHSIIFRRGNP